MGPGSPQNGGWRGTGRDGLRTCVCVLFVGWQVGVQEHTCPSKSIYSSEGELDEDIHSNCRAPQATDKTKPQKEACRNQGEQ